ncbi:hypothetical protein M427DRAFT_52324 [Gonapodya prolifera JEL478]|uniref:Uncharacterized protein n=1 Tax=Gonapodya prolifera (strain JEL478) TaxID=1344416 RepID=A0A139ATK3_GONPJ|nr:hypothetical protein M427DRAFT_52324 [Gonapodya prolifera JEL478]|eukprot:KXS20058.1 hypothetical protein M427DRAFT_52324 [Gonapodya prolifera JEL478]
MLAHLHHTHPHDSRTTPPLSPPLSPSASYLPMLLFPDDLYTTPLDDADTLMADVALFPSPPNSSAPESPGGRVAPPSILQLPHGHRPSPTPPPVLSHPPLPPPMDASAPPSRATHLSNLRRHLDATRLPPGTVPPFALRVLGVPLVGARSRVETQTRVCVQIVQRGEGSGDFSPDGTGGADALGSFSPPPSTLHSQDASTPLPRLSHIRVPDYSLASRERLRRSVAEEETNGVPQDDDVAFLETVVVCASGGGGGGVGREVLCCGGCVAREVKRTRTRASSPQPGQSSSSMDEDPLFRDPGKRILLFNTNRYVDFESGSAILPTRVTCYCRHWDERVGFCIYFILRDHTSRVLATGLSPPILVTDDHKSAPKPSMNAVPGPGLVLSKPIKPPPSRSTPLPAKRRGRASSEEEHGKVGPVAMARQRRRERVSLVGPLAGVGAGPGTAQVKVKREPESPRSPPSAPGTPGPAPADDSKGGAVGVASVVEQLAARMDRSPPPPTPIVGAGARPWVVETDGAMYIGYAADEAHHGLHAPGGVVAPATGRRRAEDAGDPVIARVVPGEGPLAGGVDVTVLGRGFRDGLTVLFGDVPSPAVQVWNANTLVVVLPPARMPGPVVVGFKDVQAPADARLGGEGMPLFLYKDDSDRALLELALQVVGIRLSGTIDDARSVALRIIAEQTGVAGMELITGGGAGSPAPGLQAALALAGPMPKERLEAAVAAAVRALAGSGEDVKRVLRTKNSGGWTIGHLAVLCDVPKVLDALVNVGGVAAIVERAESSWGWTPMQLGMWLGRARCVDVLLRAGCEWEGRDAAGRGWSDIVTMAGGAADVKNVMERWEAEQKISWEDEVEGEDDTDQWVTEDEDAGDDADDDGDQWVTDDERTEYSEGPEAGQWLDEAVSERTAGDVAEVLPASLEVTSNRSVSDTSVVSVDVERRTRARSRSVRRARTASLGASRGAVVREQWEAEATRVERTRSASGSRGQQGEADASCAGLAVRRSNSFAAGSGINIAPLVPLEDRHGDGGFRHRNHHRRQLSGTSVMDYPPDGFPTNLTAPAAPPQEGLFNNLPWPQGAPNFQMPSMFEHLPTFENPFAGGRWQEYWHMPHLPNLPQMPGFPNVAFPGWVPERARFPLHPEPRRETIPGGLDSFPQGDHHRVPSGHVPPAGTEGWFWRRQSIFGMVPEPFKGGPKNDDQGTQEADRVKEFLRPAGSAAGSSADAVGVEPMQDAVERESVLFSFWLPILTIMMLFAMSRFVVDNHQLFRTLAEFVTFAVLGGRAPAGFPHGGGGGGGGGPATFVGFGANNDGPPLFEVVAAA